MTRKNYSIDQLSTATVRQAHSEIAMMQSDLRKLRAGIAGLTGSIKQPVIKTPRLKTKKTTDIPFSILGVSGAGIAGYAFNSAVGLGTIGYSSSMQTASNTLAALMLGQRIR